MSEDQDREKNLIATIEKYKPIPGKKQSYTRSHIHAMAKNQLEKLIFLREEAERKLSDPKISIEEFEEENDKIELDKDIINSLREYLNVNFFRRYEAYEDDYQLEMFKNFMTDEEAKLYQSSTGRNETGLDFMEQLSGKQPDNPELEEEKHRIYKKVQGQFEKMIKKAEQDYLTEMKNERKGQKWSEDEWYEIAREWDEIDHKELAQYFDFSVFWGDKRERLRKKIEEEGEEEEEEEEEEE